MVGSVGEGREGMAFGGQFFLDRANEDARLMAHWFAAQYTVRGTGQR
jgi:hypothetical protein